MAQKRTHLVFIVASVAVALSVAVAWRTTHRRPSPPEPYVGKWRFTSGEIKAGPGFYVSDKVAPDGTTSQSLAGHLAVVERRNGVLWYMGDDKKSCSYELRVGDGKAEVVPDGKAECDKSAPDGGVKRSDYVRMSMVIDAQDRAHVSGEARTALEYKGQRRDVTVTYQGIAVRDMPPGTDAAHSRPD